MAPEKRNDSIEEDGTRKKGRSQGEKGQGGAINKRQDEAGSPQGREKVVCTFFFHGFSTGSKGKPEGKRRSGEESEDDRAGFLFT